MDVRERIIQRALEQFMTMGIRKVTMDSLASDLNISKRTIYEKFRDKDTLVIECIRHMILSNNDELLDIIEKSANVIEALLCVPCISIQCTHYGGLR